MYIAHTIRGLATGILIATFAAPGAQPAGAQSPAPDSSPPQQADVQPEAGSPAALDPSQAQHTATPTAAAQSTQPPRTLRAYWHLFVAFAVTWVLLFGYAVTIGRRWARLEREVQQLGTE